MKEQEEKLSRRMGGVAATVAYRVCTKAVAQTEQAGTKLVFVQLARVVPIEMVEGGPILSQLVLRESELVTDENLVFHLIDAASDGTIQLSPCSTQCLHTRGGDT